MSLLYSNLRIFIYVTGTTATYNIIKMEDYYSSDIDLKVLLELLKSDDDPIVVHQHCYSLQCQLSRSEEKQLADFPLNGYITRLIEILGHTVVMDFQLETKSKLTLNDNV